MAFRETQRFTQWWLHVLFAVITAPFLYGLFVQLILGKPFGENPANNTVLLVISLIPIGLWGFFIAMKLETYINDKGIYFQFKPIQPKPTLIPWNEVSKINLVTYGALSEYGGWGIRFGNNSKALTTGGNRGLKIELKRSNNLLLGTHSEEQLSIFLKENNYFNTSLSTS